MDMYVDNVVYFCPIEIATFNRFELLMKLEDAELLSGTGDHSNDAQAVLEQPYMIDQFRKLDPNLIRTELKEYGAWDEEQLADDNENALRLVWLAGNDIVEQKENECDEYYN